MNKTIELKGGARIDGFNTTWPFAKLVVSDQILQLCVFKFEYRFPPEKIVSIERHAGIFSSGLRIKHSISGYPEHIVFWCFGDVGRLIDEIRSVGFWPIAESH